MTKYWVEYSDTFTPSPLSSWVHRPTDSEVWDQASKFDPPLPKKSIDKGYPNYKIEYRGSVFSFSSLEEIDHCISIFKRKALPTTHELASNSWMKGYQHLHWLSKWPGNLKSFKDREAIIKLLEKVKEINT